MQKWKQERFLLSTFEAIRNAQGDYDALLKATADSGIDLVELVFKNRETVTDILPHFRGTGLKAIVQDRVMGGIGDMMSDPDRAAVQETLAHYRPYDDVIEGYYLWDEPVEAAFPMCRRLREHLEAEAPEKLLLFNIFPSYGVYKWEKGFYQWEDNSYVRYVDSFMKEVEPAMLAMDHYPYRPTPTTLHHSDFWRDVGYCSRRARESGVPFWFYIQGVDLSTGDLGALTVPHVAAQMFGALAYDAKELSWFCSMGVLTDVEGNRMPEFEDFKALNYRVKAVGNYLFPFALTALTHSDLDEQENAMYFANAAIDGVTALPEGVVASLFTAPDGRRCLMLMNKDTEKAVSGRVAFAEAVEAAPVSNVDASVGAFATADAWDVTIAAGDVALWELRG